MPIDPLLATNFSLFFVPFPSQNILIIRLSTHKKNATTVWNLSPENLEFVHVGILENEITSL